MTWVAAIVIWGTAQWGLVHDASLIECQRKADAMTKQYGLERVDCISVSRDHLSVIQSLKVSWQQDRGNPVLYACTRRGCNEVGQ